MGDINISRTNKGFTLIEMLVATTVFAFLAVVSTQILALSLQGVTKSQNIAETRENIDNATSTIARLLNSAESCTIGSSPFEYQDQYGNDLVIDCITDASGNYIASDSARITSTEVNIDCAETSITCTRDIANRPFVVDIRVSGEDNSHSGTIEDSTYTSSTRVLIRNYSSN